MHISEVFCTFIPMKEQVTDISKVLQVMTGEMRLLRETVNQQAEIVKLNRNINALNLQVHKTDTELTNLRERLAKYENPDRTLITAARRQARSV